MLKAEAHQRTPDSGPRRAPVEPDTAVVDQQIGLQPVAPDTAATGLPTGLLTRFAAASPTGVPGPLHRSSGPTHPEDAATATDVAADRQLVPVALRRSSGAVDPLGGTRAAPEVWDALRQQGGGSPLGRADADRFGSQLGTDLSTVRVHTGPGADSIARSVQATAFTHGTDIYFSEGSYAPGTSAGDHLLAHELAHVAQGTAGASASTSGPPMIGRADDPVEAAADRIADSVMDGLQHRTFDDTTPVTPVPGAVRRQRDPRTIRRVFGKVKKVAKSLFGKAKPVEDTKTGDDYMDTKTHEERIQHNRRYRGSGPGENPDYSNPALFGAEPDEWRVTLAVAQEDTAWMRNVKDLKKTALKELVRSPRELLGDMGAAEQRLAQKTLMSRGDLNGKTEAEVQQLVEKFSDGIHDVGHTWIRMGTYVGGQLKELYTYGMWPQKLYSPGEYAQTYGGYAGPIAVGPGEVRHPDIAHEGDATKAYKHYPVKEKDFRKAMDMAVERYNNPPPYVLTGYNCTAFAREIVQAAGGSYPGKGLLPGMAYTPGNLYWAIMKEWVKGKKNVATQDTEEDSKAMGKLAARAKAFGEAGEANVEGEYKTATFKLPEPGQKRTKIKLHQGGELRFGMYPTTLDQKVTLDDDTDYIIIDDKEFILANDIVPIEMGAQILFVDADDFYDAAKPPKQLSQRETFLAQGLSYWGTFRPPKDSDKAMGAWTEQEVGKMTLIDIKDPNQTKDWVAVSNRGDIYWVRRDHFAIFTNPGSVTFDDEKKPDSNDGGGGSVQDARGDAKRAKQRAAVVKVLGQFAGMGSMMVGNMLSTTALTENGVKVNHALIKELLDEDPSFADDVCKILKCTPEDLRIDFG
jgi:hypothetical protein